jgi:hypothetical protein
MKKRSPLRASSSSTNSSRVRLGLPKCVLMYGNQTGKQPDSRFLALRKEKAGGQSARSNR